MNTSRLSAGASRFAHFAGWARNARRADADDDQQDDEPKGKKSRAAEEDDDDEPKGKKSRRAEEDDDEDAEEDDDKDEMEGRSAKASARRREQSRIASILGNKAAARNLTLALSLACDTRMTRREAIAVLKAQPAESDDDDRGGNRHARRDRSDRNVNLGGGSREVTGPEAVTASWDKAFAKAGVPVKKA